MSTTTYIWCSVMYLIGHGIDLFLVKIPELRLLWAKSNEKFSWNKYWTSDWNVISGTILVGVALVIGIDEIGNWKPEVMKVVKWFFLGLGALASTVIASKFGTAKKYIMKIIDIKANIVSNDIGKTEGIADLKQAAAQQGKDITTPNP